MRKKLDAVEEGEEISSTREEGLTQKYVKETVALVSSKAGKEVPVEVALSSSRANTDTSADGGALTSKDADANEAGND